MTPLCSRPKGSSLVDHRGFVQCFQLGGWLEEVPPRQNQCILRELAQDWQAVTCLKEITHSEQVATCSFHWLGDSTKTWNDETFHGLGNHQGIAAGKLRRRRLEDILQRVMTGDGGNFKFWSMWDVSMLWLPFAWAIKQILWCCRNTLGTSLFTCAAKLEEDKKPLFVLKMIGVPIWVMNG